MDEAEFEDEARWAGWRAGHQAFVAGLPLRRLAPRAHERGRTFARRRAADSWTPRLRVRVALAYAEEYIDGALSAAWRWAWDHGDMQLAAEVRAYFLAEVWPS